MSKLLWLSMVAFALMFVGVAGTDAQMRAPVVNKMFQCGMIP